MSYITPPVFTNATILTAGNLNILADDLEYINAITDYINVPFLRYVYGIGTDQDMSEQRWTFRHQHRYLHYLMICDSEYINNPIYIAISWGAGNYTVWDNGISNLGAGGSLSSDVNGAIDLAPYSIPANAFLDVWWGGVVHGLATAHFFFESDTATL